MIKKTMERKSLFALILIVLFSLIGIETKGQTTQTDRQPHSTNGGGAKFKYTYKGVTLWYQIRNSDQNAKVIGYAYDPCPTEVVIPDTTYNGSTPVRVTRVDYLTDCDNLKSVTIPKSVEVVTYVAFTNCPNLTTIILENSTPPRVGGENGNFTTDTPFSSLDEDRVRIIVPEGSLPNYKGSYYWKAYTNQVVNESDTICFSSGGGYRFTDTLISGADITIIDTLITTTGIHKIAKANGDTLVIDLMVLGSVKDTIIVPLCLNEHRDTLTYKDVLGYTHETIFTNLNPSETGDTRLVTYKVVDASNPNRCEQDVYDSITYIFKTVGSVWRKDTIDIPICSTVASYTYTYIDILGDTCKTTFTNVSPGDIIRKEYELRDLGDQNNSGCENNVKDTIFYNFTQLQETKTTNMIEVIKKGSYYAPFGSNGQYYRNAGDYDYTQTTKTSSGCDSTTKLTLIVVDNVTTKEIWDTICSGHSFKLGDMTYGATGTYSQLYKSGSGRNTITVTVTLHLVVVKPKSTVKTLNYCSGTVPAKYIYEDQFGKTHEVDLSGVTTSQDINQSYSFNGLSCTEDVTFRINVIEAKTAPEQTLNFCKNESNTYTWTYKDHTNYAHKETFKIYNSDTTITKSYNFIAADGTEITGCPETVTFKIKIVEDKNVNETINLCKNTSNTYTWTYTDQLNNTHTETATIYGSDTTITKNYPLTTEEGSCQDKVTYNINIIEPKTETITLNYCKNNSNSNERLYF